MDTLMQSEIFFFISSIGFIILGILLMVLIIYLIRAADTFSRIMNKVEKDVDSIGDTTKEMLEDMRDSTWYRLLFGHKRKTKKIHTSHK